MLPYWLKIKKTFLYKFNNWLKIEKTFKWRLIFIFVWKCNQINLELV